MLEWSWKCSGKWYRHRTVVKQRGRQGVSIFPPKKRCKEDDSRKETQIKSRSQKR